MLWNPYIGHVTRTTIEKEESKALIGWKRNYLVRNSDGDINVKAIAVGIQSGLNSEASCNILAGMNQWSLADQNKFLTKRFKKNHKLVGAHCTCGFYAYPDRKAAEEHPQESKGSVLLEVAISGKFMQYKKGFRYAHQRVTKIVVEKCDYTYCTSQAVLLLKPDLYSAYDILTPSCLYHSTFEGRKRLSFEDVSLAVSNQPSISKFPPIVVETADGTDPWVRTPAEIVTSNVGKISKVLSDPMTALILIIGAFPLSMVGFSFYNILFAPR